MSFKEMQPHAAGNTLASLGTVADLENSTEARGYHRLLSFQESLSPWGFLSSHRALWLTAGQVGEHGGSSAGLTRSSPMSPPTPSLFNPPRFVSVIDSFSLAVMWKRSVSGLRCESSTLLPSVAGRLHCQAVSVAWTYHSLPSQRDGHRGSFQFWATMNKAVITSFYKSFCGHVFFFLLGKHLGLELWVVGQVCLFCKKSPSFSSMYLYHIWFHQDV